MTVTIIFAARVARAAPMGPQKGINKKFNAIFKMFPQKIELPNSLDMFQAENGPTMMPDVKPKVMTKPSICKQSALEANLGPYRISITSFEKKSRKKPKGIVKTDIRKTYFENKGYNLLFLKDWARSLNIVEVTTPAIE